MEQGRGGGLRPRADGDPFAEALAGLITSIRGACEDANEWPERVGAGLYAGIDFLVQEKEMARVLLDDPDNSRFGEPFRQLVQNMSELLEEDAPVRARPGPGTPAAAIAGVGLVVGDHVRVGRADRLPELCPEMHLMILLPFLSFEEARGWAETYKRK
ncbi:MAG TPA: hypothetical protein VFL77_12775 [Solirubrobacterales bacterium]|nr:hypothetical protein [Solirubrobacterales bacterium]